MCEAIGDNVRQGLLQLRSHFVVEVRDAFNTRITRGGDKVRASSRGPGPLKPSVTDEGDGTYTVTYLATVSGTYSLAVSCNSTPIHGSPFSITVEPSVAHTPNCVADGDGLRGASAGVATSFFIRARDEFNRPKIMGGEAFEAFLRPVADAGGAAADEEEERGNAAEEALAKLASPRTPRTPRRPTATHGAGALSAASPVPVAITDLSNGSYEGRYTARRSGDYYLHVVRAGTHIGGSPFLLRVHAARSDASACVLHLPSGGDGAQSVCVAGRPATLRLSTFDRYGNPAELALPDADGPYDAGDEVEAVVQPIRVEHPTLPIKCRVSPAADRNGYDIAYTATAAGDYEVRVSVRRTALKSFPSLTVLPDVASAAASTASGDGLVHAIAGQRATFELVSRDRFGNPCDSADDPYVAHLIPTSTASSRRRPWRRRRARASLGGGGGGEEDGELGVRPAPIEAEIHPKGDGLYLAAYTATEHGTYRLEVRLGRELLPGAPFRLTVHAAGVAPHACRVAKAGPPAILAGQTALMCFESCDGHGNRRTNGGDAFVVGLLEDTSASDELPQASEEALLAVRRQAAWAAELSPRKGAAAVDVSDAAIDGTGEAPSSRRPPPPMVLDERNGIYTVGYGWSRAGALKLSITYDGAALPGSPFALAVLPGEPSADHCLVYGDGLGGCAAGARLRLGVLLRDKYNNVCEQRASGVRVSLRGAADVEAEVREAPHARGLEIEATATPQAAGRYWIHVHLGDAPLAGSPFLVHVRPAAAMGASAEVWGDGLREAVAGMPAYFAVQLRDALGNVTMEGAEGLTARVAAPPQVGDRGGGGGGGGGGDGDGDAAAAAEARALGVLSNSSCECELRHMYMHDQPGFAADGDAPPPPPPPPPSSPRGQHPLSPSRAGPRSPPHDSASDPGLFSGVWRSMQVGRHFLHLQLHGEPLPGSPFAIAVVGGPLYASASTLSLEGGTAQPRAPEELLIGRIIARDRGNRGVGGEEFTSSARRRAADAAGDDRPRRRRVRGAPPPARVR